MTNRTRSISPRDARRLALHCQRLTHRQPFGKGKQAVNDAIDHMGYVQIDTISVVQRAHHHVLWSRIPHYRIGMLDELQGVDRSIFEYWSHAAAYLPMSDYRFVIPTMEYYLSGTDPWPKAESQLKTMVLDRIRNEGPLMSKDFKRAEISKGDGWWDWKPAKLALQRLFFEGKLMVQRRQGFQRIYDLAERVLPDDVDTSRPSTEDYADYLIHRTLNAHGLATPQQIAYLRRGMAASVTKRLLELVEEDVVMPLTIGRGQVVYYAEAGLLSSAGIRVHDRMRILSPFDNCVIQRKRLSELWNYDYQIECYIPEPKRIYGYFCLPLLFGDHFIGRIDVKAERKSKLLHVRHVVKEHAMDDYLFVSELMAALESFMGFNGCTDIKIQRTSPRHLKSLFRAY